MLGEERIKLELSLKAIDKEIEWCKNNTAEGVTEEFRTGFIKGLEQAKHLITSLLRMATS